MKLVATEVKVFYPQLKVGIDRFPLYVFKVPFTGRTEFVFTELSEKEMGIVNVGEEASCRTALPFLADIMGYLYSLENESYMSLTEDCGSIVYRNVNGYFILSYFGGFYRIELDGSDSKVLDIVSKLQGFLTKAVKAQYITEVRVHVDEPTQDGEPQPITSTAEESMEVEDHAEDVEENEEVSEISEEIRKNVEEIKKGVTEILNKNYE